jgi:hypothetical protein
MIVRPVDGSKTGQATLNANLPHGSAIVQSETCRHHRHCVQSLQASYSNNTISGLNMSLRNGRFKGSAGQTIDIAVGRRGTLRVFSTGGTSFDVKVNSPSGDVSTPVVRDQSVDILMDADARSIKVTGASAFEGVYEFLERGRDIRSGHYKGQATTKVTLVQGGDNLIYRVMNSGDFSFEIESDGDAVVSLPPGFSIDVGVDNSLTISRADGQVVEAIFDTLTIGSEVRSGRFRARPEVDGMGNVVIQPPYPYTIIDLKKAGTFEAWYRLFNSGDKAIAVKHPRGAAFNPIGVVPPQCSLDFKISAAANERLVLVEPATAGDVIDGSIDLVQLS